MADPTDKSPRTAARRRPRRLWSLPTVRAAHGMPNELQAILRTMVEASWLLPGLILAYVALSARGLSPDAIKAILGGVALYAAALLGLGRMPMGTHTSPWLELGRCWAMTALVTFVLWQLHDANSPLFVLYHLVVIVSAVALGSRLTLLNLALIGCCLLLLGRMQAHELSDGALAGLQLTVRLVLMAVVAYIVTRVAGDIRKALERVRFISETDELTRLYNLRAFMSIAERLHRQAKRYGRPYAIVMIDSDNLKAINDAYGHQRGNDLLKLTTACIRRELRETDVAARYGGDEFILLLPETGPAGARELSERVRCAVAARSLKARGLPIGTTVSLGVASFPEHGTDLRSILNKADQAMYLSKQTGRNRVTLFRSG